LPLTKSLIIAFQCVGLRIPRHRIWRETVKNMGVDGDSENLKNVSQWSVSQLQLAGILYAIETNSQ